MGRGTHLNRTRHAPEWDDVSVGQREVGVEVLHDVVDALGSRQVLALVQVHHVSLCKRTQRTNDRQFDRHVNVAPSVTPLAQPGNSY